MLLRLIIFRLFPLTSLRFCKEKKQMKLAVMIILVCYCVSFFAVAAKMISEKYWLGILYVPLSMFPHYLFYGFSLVILMRCIWHAWSERVWKRIYSLAQISVILGILTETYINPKILQFFFGIFK